VRTPDFNMPDIVAIYFGRILWVNADFVLKICCLLKGD
jgi:hypothetical protein